jgi:hypothetical protein
LVLTRATWRNIPEDAILHSHRRENRNILMVTDAEVNSKHEINQQLCTLTAITSRNNALKNFS